MYIGKKVKWTYSRKNDNRTKVNKGVVVDNYLGKNGWRLLIDLGHKYTERNLNKIELL